MINVKQHIPPFCDGFNPIEHEISNLKDLLDLDFVKQFKEQNLGSDFYKYSLDHFIGNTYLLMAEYDSGKKWFVVAYLDNFISGLPKWIPNEEVDDD